MRIYQDSKELTARVYERIETTGDYRFMIKGYQIGDEIECDIDQLEAKFKEVVQDYIVQINAKSIDFENYGKLQKANNDFNILSHLLALIDLQQQINELSKICGVDSKDIISEAFSVVRIPRSKDLEKQKEIILTRIKKIENEALDINSKISKKDSAESNVKICMDEIVVWLNVILSINIDMDKTSIFQIGKYLEMANKKNEETLKNSRNGRK